MSNLPAITKDDVHASRAGAILPQTINEAITVAKTLFVSKLFPDLTSAEQAVAKIMAGAELGIPPVASLNAFHIVKGKIMLHYAAIAGAIRRAGYGYRVLEHTEELCTVAFFNPDGEEIGAHSFTQADAKRAQTQNMDKLPKVMLFARCISQGARIYVPEAFNGMIVYEFSERRMIDEDALTVEEEPEQKAIGTSAVLDAKITDMEVPDEFDPFETEDTALFGDEDK